MSNLGKEYKLAIRIAGVIDKSFTTSLAATNASLKSTFLSLDKDFKKLDKGFNSIMKAGQKTFQAIATAAGVATLAIGAATAASIAVGTEFESAFAGVKKTVDATEEEYARLRQDILDMTRTIPSSASEIAEVMEIAGQLGIAKDSLTDFTETMINLGVSTNLAAEEAATNLARFANIMSMDAYAADGISNYERLGSTVVDLGNKFAVTEAEIVAIAEALAAAGNLAGMSEADIMGISAAMGSVGLTAEAGASSMSRLIMQMQQAVSEGGEGLAGYAETAGMTSTAFTDLFRTNAAGAVVEFIEGLNAAGEGSYEILEDLDLSTIRLRKSFLSLAGADDLMNRTLTIANEAWSENTALAIEAGKRYETVESKLQIMLNAFKELGIEAFEDLREPFVDVIGDITDKVHEFQDYVSGPNGIGDWVEGIGEKLPTLQRKFKKYGEPVFNGILGAGKWIVKHGDGIISVLVGMGTALVAYKTASTLTHIVSTLMSLGPAAWGIIGVTAAIGALAAGIMACNQYADEMADKSLAEHFGNIALSMEDIQAIAEHIVGSDSLNSVREALAAFEDLDYISGLMEDNIAEINKLNWKVSIGMQLTPDEQESYKTAISEYVTSAQEYALQSGYSINLSMAFIDDTAEGASIASKVNEFYQNSYDEMVVLGEQLSTAVNEAFADNVLDPDEVGTIADLQAKIAEAQQKIALNDYNANLALLSKQYGGANLTPESFLNLQAGASEAAAELNAGWYDVLQKQMSGIENTKAGGGYANEAEYKAAQDYVYQEYLDNITNTQLDTTGYFLDSITEAYGSEMSKFYETFYSEIGEFMHNVDFTDSDWMGQLQAHFAQIFDSVEFGDQGAFAEFYSALETDLQQLEEIAGKYTAAGKKVPEEINAAIEEINSYKAMSGDDEGLWTMFASYIADSEEYSTLIEAAKQNGAAIPAEIGKAITDEGNMLEIRNNVNTVLGTVKTELEDGVYATIPVYYDLVVQTLRYNGSAIRIGEPTLHNFQGAINSFLDIAHNADGGFINGLTLSWLGEEGPEAVIPLDGSQNAISLWEKAGRLLGMDSRLGAVDLSGGGSTTKIEYSPTLQFYGEAPNQIDLENALKISQDDFDSLMERYFKTHGRVSFG